MIHILWWKWDFKHFRNGPPDTCIYDHDAPMYMDIFPEGEEVQYVDEFTQLPLGAGAIVVLNGAKMSLVQFDELRELIKPLPWVVVFSVQDDNSRFPLHILEHPNMKIWVHAPKPGVRAGKEPFSWAAPHHDYARRLPVGYTKMFRRITAEQRAVPRVFDWSFTGITGQSTRLDWWNALRDLCGSAFHNPTMEAPKRVSSHEGLSPDRQIWCNKGHWVGMLADEDYVSMTCASKIAICRPASCTPETGRLYEALEAGCVPIVTRTAPGAWGEVYDWTRYQEYIFGETPPFPVIDGPNDLQAAIQDALREWPENAHRISIWWTDYKERLKKTLWEEVRELQQ